MSDHDDLIRRLRVEAEQYDEPEITDECEAANAIERLTQERDEARNALRRILNNADTLKIGQIARQALLETDHG